MRQLQSLLHDFTPNTARIKIKAAQNGGGQEKGECAVRRYDRIMQAISLGLSDSEIAAKHGTGSATIHVYRMVHDGTLPIYADLTYKVNRYGGWVRDGETIADRLARTIKGWHA